MAFGNPFGLSMFSRQRRASKPSRQGTPKRGGTGSPRKRNLRMESLEERQLLAVNPLITFTKTDMYTTAAPNDSLDYFFELSYSDAATTPLTNVKIIERVPDGCTIDPANPPGWELQGDGSYEYTIGDMNPGDTAGTIPFVVLVDANPTVTQIVNTATISNDQGDSNTAQDIDNVLQPVFSISKDDGRTTAAAGDHLVYTITYSSTVATTNVLLTDQVPEGTTFDAANSPGWTLTSTPGVYELSVPALAANTPQTAQFAVFVNDPVPDTVTSIENIVVIEDGVNLPNSASDIPDVITTQTPVFTISKTDGKTTTVPGDHLIYTISYISTVAATNVVLEETLPAGTTFDAANSPGWTPVGGGVYELSVPSLPASTVQTAQFAVFVNNPVPSGQTTVQNTVEIRDGVNLPATSSPDIDTISTAPVVLTVSKNDGVSTVAPGDTLTYTINYANTSTTAVANLSLVDVLPAGLTFTAQAGWTQTGTTLTYNVGTLAGLASDSATLVLKVANPVPAGLTSVSNTVTITDGATNVVPSAPDVDTLVAAPVFVVAKSDGVTTAAPGQTLAYAITYANTGNQDAAGVTLTENVPAGTTFNAAQSSAGWTLAGPGTYVLNVGNLAVGAPGSATFAVTVDGTVPAGLDNIVNTVTIADNASHTATSPADSDTLVAAPDLAVTKTDGATQVAPGQTVQYTIAYSNTGTQGATGVVLTDTLPASGLLTFNPASNPGWTLVGSDLTYNVGAVAAGASSTATLILTVSAAAVQGDTVVNTVAIADDGLNGADPTPADNTATDSDTVGGVDLAIAKSLASAASVIAGQVVTYNITVTNVGAGDAPNVTVTDVLPAGTTFVAASAPAGFTVTSPDAGYSGTLTCTTASLAAGQSATLTLTVQTDADSPNNTSITNTATVASSLADMNPADNTATSGATTVRMTGVAVVPSSTDPTKNDLIIGGSGRNDVILVYAAGGGCSVYMNGAFFGPFTVSGRIVAYGRGGSDQISVNSTVRQSAMLFGDGGNDRLYAGGGNTVLVGGDGNDTLVSGRGKNILIGGRGADSLFGTSGGNILIGGSTIYDAHEIALGAILDEWSRDLAYWKQVRHIWDGGAGILPTGLNGNYYFNPITLRDDAARDLLLGGSGMNYFFAHTSGGGVYDSVVGLKTGVEWLRTY